MANWIAGKLEIPHDDIALWNAFREGDATAFSLLYRKHIRMLYRYGRKIVSDTQILEDALQDVFAELWNSRQNLGATDSVKYYLFRVLRRKIGKHLKYNETFNSTYADELDYGTAAGTASRDVEIMEEELGSLRVRSLHDALRKLPERQREIINLRYFHEFSQQEIAGIMGITLQSVHNLLQKSMKSLRQLLKNRELLWLLLWGIHTHLQELLGFSPADEGRLIDFLYTVTVS